MADRKPIEAVLLEVAEVLAQRATCDRAAVGCVIARDGFILSTGYNGSAPGMPHCTEAGHIMRNGSCVRTIHAEANAVAHAARHGVSLSGATAYCTMAPCRDCAKLLVAAGVKTVVYGAEYHAIDVEVIDSTGLWLRKASK